MDEKLKQFQADNKIGKKLKLIWISSTLLVYLACNILLTQFFKIKYNSLIDLFLLLFILVTMLLIVYKKFSKLTYYSQIKSFLFLYSDLRKKYENYKMTIEEFTQEEDKLIKRFSLLFKE